MTSNFVTDIIRRSNRNLLLWSFLGALIVVGAGIYFLNYYRNLFLGPFPTDKKSVAVIQDLKDVPDYYITLEGDEALDTGYQYVSTNYGQETVEFSYIALMLNDVLLLVKSPGIALVNLPTTYTGALVPMPADIQREVIRDLEAEYPDLKDVFLPFMLDAGDFKTNGYIGLGIGVIIFLGCLYGIFLSARRSNNMASHPIMRKLKAFGSPEAIANQIHAEMQGPVEKVGHLNVTQHWLLRATKSSLAATRLNDVVWYYKKATQHRTNFIPTGKTYEAVILDRRGTIMSVQAKENVVNEMLNYVGRNAPWAIGGYSNDLKMMWDRQHKEFIAAVDQRRQSAPSIDRQ